MANDLRPGVSRLRGGKFYRWVVAIAILLALGTVFYIRANPCREKAGATLESKEPTKTVPTVQPREPSLPRLIDLGADKCIPCKMMAPVLKQLRREYAGVFEVEIVDVWKNPEEVNRFKLKGIPTQIFLDAAGQELYRHMGFLSKEDILGKWKELGVPIEREPRDE